MITKKVAAIAAAAVIAVGVGAYGMASAYGSSHGHWHGHGHGGGFFLLAHAAGISGSDIRTAFQNDATKLQNDRTTVKNDRQNLINCLLSTSTPAPSCSSYVNKYLTDKQTAESDKLAIWQTLFASAPNKANAANVLGELQQLRAERKQILQQAFSGGSAASSDAPSEAPTSNQ